ncbi:MAG: glycosyltransferase [candidate division WOR-3 bacterium]
MENKKMRICVISYHSSLLHPVGEGFTGGMDIYLSNLYRRLSKDLEVDIMCRGEGNRRKIENCNLIYINSIKPEDFSEKIIHFLSKKRYHLIHSHYWLSGIVAMKIKELFPFIPWVHTFHTIEALKGISKDSLRMDIEEEIIRKCDLIISSTLKEKNWIKKISPKAFVEVILPGVSFNDFPFKKDGSKNILFVGRLDPIKGVDILIESLRFLKGDFSLTIVGGPSKDESYFEYLKSIAQNYPVRFLGRIPHEKLYKIYWESCMLVLPSYYESFGLVVLEAMSSGRPVVGFSDTSISEILGKRGVLTERKPKSLGEAINFLLSNPSKRSELGVELKNRVLKFSWEETGRRYIEAYEKIIKNHSIGNGAS